MQQVAGLAVADQAHADEGRLERHGGGLTTAS
jgi:hypothetical protein